MRLFPETPEMEMSRIAAAILPRIRECRNRHGIEGLLGVVWR
jgi:hypothetical protein